MALGLYRAEGIDVAHVKQVADAPTGVGFIVVEEASGNNCIVLDPGANERLTAADVGECASAIKSSAIVLTQLEIPAAAAEAALRLGRAAGAMTILNPAPVRSLPGSILELVDVLTPNETEAKVLAGRNSDAAVELEQIARELIHGGVKQVVITLGEKGVLLVTASSSAYFPAAPMTAVDTTGAGDAFNAGLATALAYGATVNAAVEFAVVTGGLAVTKEGVIPSLPRRADLVQHYRQRGLALPEWFSGEVGHTS
jgi:ribokinase